MADFDDQGIIGKAFKKCREIRNGLLRAVKRKRELEENGAEFAGSAEDVKASADGTLEAVLTSDVSPTWISLYGGRVQWTAFDNPGVVGSCALGVAE